MTNKFWSILLSMIILIKVTSADTIDENVSLQASPNWIGTWKTDTKCDKLSCCCLFDYLALAAVENGTKLQMIGNLDGIGVCASKIILFGTIDMPNDFIIPISFGGEYPVNLTLSQDSGVVSVINPNGTQCTTIALRLQNDTATISTNAALLIALLSGLTGMKSFF